MLDPETLKALADDLSARTLYSAEVARLPQLSRAEEVALTQAARQGVREARMALVLSCLRYALGKARALYNERRPEHDEVGDLVQVASLEMLADLDVALGKRNPASYLRGIAARAISLYISYRGGLIRKPSLSREELARRAAPTMESFEIIEVAPPDITREEEDPRRRFGPLYEAVEMLLTPRQRNYFIKRYGLDMPLVESDAATAQYTAGADMMHKLREALEPHLSQMLHPEDLEE